MSEVGKRLSQREARHEARVFALQAIYAWLVKDGSSTENVGEIDAHMRSEEQFALIDQAHFTAIFYGVTQHQEALRQSVLPFLDRPIQELSYVEHAIILLSAYELHHHVEIPYRVVINEGIVLAKAFGGNDGYKYVNGVLDKLSATVRAQEVAAQRS